MALKQDLNERQWILCHHDKKIYLKRKKDVNAAEVSSTCFVKKAFPAKGKARTATWFSKTFQFICVCHCSHMNTALLDHLWCRNGGAGVVRMGAELYTFTTPEVDSVTGLQRKHHRPTEVQRWCTDVQKVSEFSKSNLSLSTVTDRCYLLTRSDGSLTDSAIFISVHFGLQ